MSLSVLIIGFLISTSSLNVVNTKALVGEEYKQYNDSFDSSAGKWTTTEVVSTESTVGSWWPSLAVDTLGNIHVAWYDETDYAGAGTDLDIFYKRWEASTFSWTTTEVVSTVSGAASYSPSLAVDTSGNVHLAWHDLTDYAGAGGTDYDIFYIRWDASSSSWTTTEIVSTESTGSSSTPSLAVDTSGNVHVAWEDFTDYAGAGTDRDIFYKRWDVSSSSWTTAEVVSIDSYQLVYRPSLAVDTSGNVHIAWEDKIGTDYDIFYRSWNTSSSTWTATERVSTESTSDSHRLSLAVDTSGNVHIAWEDWTNYAGAGTDVDIFYKSWNFSSSWTTTEIVSTESTGACYSPSIAADTLGNVHVVWQDLTDYAGAGGTDYDIFYKSWNSSSSWTITEVVSTESTAESRYPYLAVDTLGNLHIAWEDRTDYAGAGTDKDIVYKAFRSPPDTVPELAFIVPNPTELTTVYLDWNNIIEATTYFVYCSTSYIWSLEGLVPIATVSLSEYTDTPPSEGFYYYVVVAGNVAANSSHSNCQYVEVIFPDLDAPELSTILPNPTDSSSISLVWDTIDEATEYHIYRSDAYIWSVELLTPIATVGSTSYIDSLPSEGYYFYVIVATDGVRNSTHSNCEHVEYKVAHVREFTIVSGLILFAFALVFVVTRTRKKNSKPN